MCIKRLIRDIELHPAIWGRFTSQCTLIENDVQRCACSCVRSGPEEGWMQISKMAAEGGGKEMNEIKTQFTTREGSYKLLTHSEYSRPNRVPFNSQGSNPVKVSFVNVNDQSGNGDRICFNVGRELYFYIYKGVRKVNTILSVYDSSFSCC